MMFTDDSLPTQPAPAASPIAPVPGWAQIAPGHWALFGGAGEKQAEIRRTRHATRTAPSVWFGSIPGLEGGIPGVGIDDAMLRVGRMLAAHRR